MDGGMLLIRSTSSLMCWAKTNTSTSMIFSVYDCDGFALGQYRVTGSKVFSLLS